MYEFLSFDGRVKFGLLMGISKPENVGRPLSEDNSRRDCRQRSDPPRLIVASGGGMKKPLKLPGLQRT